MPVTLDRERLHHAVWMMSVGALSRRLKISVGKIRAACKTMEISLPPAGYFVGHSNRSEAPTLLPDYDGPSQVIIGESSRESLAEWVESAQREAPPPVVRMPAPQRSPAPLQSPARKIASKYITLQEWGASQFSLVPHQTTLLRWVNEGRIQPQPKKIGRRWWVLPIAEYRPD